jgi:hypothetical protein
MEREDNKMKLFKVGYRGISQRTLIQANSRKEAKELFATLENTKVSAYMIAENG